MLRHTLLVLGGLFLVAALILLTHPPLLGIAFYLGVYGLVIVGGILLEQNAYRPRIHRNQSGWQPTGERFVDPTTHTLTEVWFNPDTGERDYRPV